MNDLRAEILEIQGKKVIKKQRSILSRRGSRKSSSEKPDSRTAQTRSATVETTKSPWVLRAQTADLPSKELGSVEVQTGSQVIKEEEKKKKRKRKKQALKAKLGIG